MAWYPLGYKHPDRKYKGYFLEHHPAPKGHAQWFLRFPGGKFFRRALTLKSAKRIITKRMAGGKS